MKIKRSSLWYNLMIFPNSDYREYHIRNGCKFFWFTLFNVFLWFLLVPIFIGFFLGVMAISIIGAPLAFLLVIVGFGLFMSLVWGVTKISDSELVRGFKEKHCPRVDYE